MLAPSPSSAFHSPKGLTTGLDMLRFYADKFLTVLSTLGTLELMPDPKGILEPSRRSYVSGQMAGLCAQLEELQMSVSLKKAKEIEFIFKGAVFSSEDFQAVANLVKSHIRDLRSRIEAEFESKLMFCMSDRYSKYWPGPDQISTAFLSDKFSESAYDIESAAKCLALEQGTASVLHLMRAMESAVQKLAASLGVEKVEKEWGKLLSDIRTKIEAMPKGDLRDSWSEIHANLYHVKQAWRNKTMHPLEKYTPDEASEVFESCKVFLRHLAALL